LPRIAFGVFLGCMETTGSIAKELGLDRRLVSYLVARHNIEPIGRAGRVRLFDHDAIRQVAQAACLHAFRRPPFKIGGDR